MFGAGRRTGQGGQRERIVELAQRLVVEVLGDPRALGLAGLLEPPLDVGAVDGGGQDVGERLHEAGVLLAEESPLLRQRHQCAERFAQRVDDDRDRTHDLVLTQMVRDLEAGLGGQIVDDDRTPGEQREPRQRTATDGQDEAADDARAPAGAGAGAQLLPVRQQLIDPGVLGSKSTPDLTRRPLEQRRHALTLKRPQPQRRDRRLLGDPALQLPPRSPPLGDVARDAEVAGQPILIVAQGNRQRIGDDRAAVAAVTRLLALSAARLGQLAQDPGQFVVAVARRHDLADGASDGLGVRPAEHPLGGVIPRGHHALFVGGDDRVVEVGSRLAW